MICRILQYMALCAAICSGFAVEDLRGVLYLVNLPDLTFYGRVHDLNNQNNTTFQVQICWDDPTFTRNCDTPVIANTFSYPLTTCTVCSGFHYPIPTGSVGSVFPRDGNDHLMYTKVISQANPGAGDKPIDGSPWPFRYLSGTVAPMWTPNLESNPSRLTAPQMAILANSSDPYSVGTNGNVVCTVGATQIKDDGVAGYYAKRRGVPCANIRVVTVPVAQTTTQAIFNSAIAPTVQALPASLQAIAIAWVQPSMVAYNTGGYAPQGISAAVANGSLVLGTGCPDSTVNFLGQGPINPYFNSASQAPFTDHHIRPTMMLAGEVCPACTATNNFAYQWYADFPTIKAVIDAAIAGTDTNPSGGNVYWTLNGDRTRSQTTVLVSPLELGNALSPFVNAQILGTRSAPYTKTVSAKNILMYEESAPNWNYASPTFLPGAGIGYAVTSTSGWLPSDGSQTTAASWFLQGAIGAFGNAAEPCELLVYKHPDPGLIIPNYTQGQTLVESLWKSVRLPWGANFLGDPLASPFKLQGNQGGSTPILTAINPSAAAQGTTVPVMFTGQNFVSPATVSVQGGITASSVAVASATSITANLTIPGGTAPGSYNATVATAAGVSGALPFQVTASAPTLTAIAPTSGVQGTSVTVTLTGTNFASGAAIAIGGTGVSASNISVVSASQITATFVVAPNAANGARAVSVSTSAGVSGPVTFTVNGAPAAPVLTAIAPSGGAQGTSVTVTLTGTNFISGAAIAIGGSGVSASNINVVSASQITATLVIASNAATGARAVSVSTSAGVSGPVTFTVTAVPAAPVLTSMAPSSGIAGNVVNVMLTGTNFAPGAVVSVGGGVVTVSNVSVQSTTAIAATFTIGTGAAAGNYPVTVATGTGTSNAVSFTVAGTSSAPTLTAMTPNTGQAGTSVNLILSGTNFTPTTGVRLAGVGAAVRNLVYVSPTQINVTFVLAATTATGAHNVYVTNSSGSSAILTFTVY